MVTEKILKESIVHEVPNLRIIEKPGKRTKRPFKSSHAIIFGNGNSHTLTFGETSSAKVVDGTPGWRFDADIGNYVPIGPIRPLRDKLGRFAKGGV